MVAVSLALVEGAAHDWRFSAAVPLGAAPRAVEEGAEEAAEVGLLALGGSTSTLTVQLSASAARPARVVPREFVLKNSLGF